LEVSIVQKVLVQLKRLGCEVEDLVKLIEGQAVSPAELRTSLDLLSDHAIDCYLGVLVGLKREVKR
jgi:hypothetical protein